MDSIKHAFFVREDETHDSLCHLFLYEQLDTEWVMIDYQIAIPFNSVSFSLEYLDFNFDGINDLFIQTTCSNGYTICRGDLFECSSFGKFLIRHSEVRDLGNFRIDTARNLLIAEELEECNRAFKAVPVQIYFEIQNGILVEVDRIHKLQLKKL